MRPSSKLTSLVAKHEQNDDVMVDREDSFDETTAEVKIKGNLGH